MEPITIIKAADSGLTLHAELPWLLRCSRGSEGAGTGSSSGWTGSLTRRWTGRPRTGLSAAASPASGILRAGFETKPAVGGSILCYGLILSFDIAATLKRVHNNLAQITT